MSLIIEIILIIVILFILFSNFMVRKLHKELINNPNKTKLSGFEIAKIISEDRNDNPPHIIKKNGSYLDHYNYERNVIKLSPEVFDGENIYAAIIALNVALETKKDKQKAAQGHKFSSIIVLISYFILILGALLNKEIIIIFSFILFIIAFIIEILNLSILIQNETEVQKNYQYIESKKIIKPLEDVTDYIILLLLINIARLPYNFISYFR